MVLSQLWEAISGALQQMNDATLFDANVANQCLDQITVVLLQAQFKDTIVHALIANISRSFDFDHLPHESRKNFHQAVINELCNMFEPVKPSFTVKRGEPSVVMFVGLPRSGKTTSCSHYASYHKSIGFQPALVCADTRPTAYKQLSRYAALANLSFSGSQVSLDPVKIAVNGVEKFKNKTRRDLIVIDTSGRHTQEADLFEEMRLIAEATKPDLVVLVIDSSIGEAAFDQVQAFKENIAVGAVIVGRMRGHAQGGAALSAVVATKTPVIFIKATKFQAFNVAALKDNGFLASELAALP